MRRHPITPASREIMLSNIDAVTLAFSSLFGNGAIADRQRRC
jgi:hypothetical protein